MGSRKKCVNCEYLSRIFFHPDDESKKPVLVGGGCEIFDDKILPVRKFVNRKCKRTYYRRQDAIKEWEAELEKGG